MYPQHPLPTPGEVRECSGGRGRCGPILCPATRHYLGQGLLARARRPLCSSKILHAEPGLRAERLPPWSPGKPSVLIRKVGMRILSQVLSGEGVTRRAARGVQVLPRPPPSLCHPAFTALAARLLPPLPWTSPLPRPLPRSPSSHLGPARFPWGSLLAPIFLPSQSSRTFPPALSHLFLL